MVKKLVSVLLVVASFGLLSAPVAQAADKVGIKPLEDRIVVH